jgi:hypothetical protein
MKRTSTVFDAPQSKKPATEETKPVTTHVEPNKKEVSGDGTDGSLECRGVRKEDMDFTGWLVQLITHNPLSGIDIHGDEMPRITVEECESEFSRLYKQVMWMRHTMDTREGIELKYSDLDKENLVKTGDTILTILQIGDSFKKSLIMETEECKDLDPEDLMSIEPVEKQIVDLVITALYHRR